MVANTSPIYTLTPDLSNNNATGMNATITAAAADYTGVSANNRLVHTAGADGSFVRRLRCKPIGTNVAAVLRVYVNNGSDPTVATNNSFIGEIPLPATTVSTTAALIDVDYNLEFALPAGWRIYVGLGAAVAAGWVVTAIAGKY
jgi:hypothetical protein